MIREDFAAAGGCSTGKVLAGLDPADSIGVEFDKAAVETARAAGYRRILADVRSDEIRGRDWGLLDGYTAGPPCQTFSMAGKGDGRKHLGSLVRAAEKVAAGTLPEVAVADVGDDHLDERSILVLEPMLVIHRHRPEWVLLEQVPAVKPVWDEYAQILAEQFGYSVATGLLNAEQYGVPQTRKRAILVARFDGEARLPAPTHSKYYPRDPARLDPGVPRWVSMYEALNFGLSERPAPTITGGGVETGGAEPIAKLARYTGRPDWIPRAMGDVYNSRGCVRPVDAPAPTMTGSMDNGNFQWVYRGSNQAHAAKRPLDRPAPTVNFAERSNKVEWMPALLAGDPKASGVRVTVQEAAVLQSFPPDYPWQGTKSQQYQQVGNAVPPLLSAACIRALRS